MIRLEGVYWARMIVLRLDFVDFYAHQANTYLPDLLRNTAYILTNILL